MPENSGQTAKRRGPGRPFAKGASGNPGGRPREAAEVRELARQHGPYAIERLAQLVDDADPRVAVRAAEVLLDRGYGRPQQAVDLSGQDGGPMQRELIVRFVEPDRRTSRDVTPRA